MRSLKDLIKKIMTTASSEIKLIISAKDEASKTLEKIGGSASKFGSAIGTVAKMAGAGLIALTGATTAFGVASVKAYGQYATIQKQLEVVLGNTKNASKEQVKALFDEAKALEKLGVVNDNTILSFQARLSQYDYGIDTIRKITPAIMDMMVAEKGANATMEDGAFYAEGFGKALQGQFDILRKRGFVISKDTENIMKNGTEAERVNEVFNLLGKTYEGVNEAMRDTPEGSVKALRMSWEQLKKTTGEALVEHLKLNGVFLALADRINKLTETDIAGYIKRGKEQIVLFTEAIKSWYQQFFSNTNYIWVFIKDFFIPIIENLRKTFTESWKKIIEAIKPIQPELTMLAKIIGVIIVGALMVAIKTIAIWIEVAVKSVTLVIQAFSKLVQALKKHFENIFSNFFSTIDKMKKGWENLANFISKPLNAVLNIKEKITGKKQFGGSVASGRSYIVGEHRPEVFVPSQSGNIKQVGQGGGGEINVNFNNVNVRSDYDLQSIIEEVKRTLNRDSIYAKYGIRT
jgi:hypothetical protein